MCEFLTTLFGSHEFDVAPSGLSRNGPVAEGPGATAPIVGALGELACSTVGRTPVPGGIEGALGLDKRAVELFQEYPSNGFIDLYS